MAAHQAPPSLGFSRQEHWSGLPFPSPMRESEVAQSYLTLSDLMDCILQGSSVHGIFQARVLEWGAIAFSDMYVCIYTYVCVCMYVYIHIFTYLAASDLSCGVQHLSLWHEGSRVCSQRLLHVGLVAPWLILVSWRGIEPESPALEGGFLTTGPLGLSLGCLVFSDGCKW